MTDGEDLRPPSWNAEALRRLLQQLQLTDVDELEVVRGEFRLHLRRRPRAPVGVVPEMAAAPEEVGVAILAPLTGVFYSRASPEHPPFVSTGDRVDEGQVVGLIETMKLFNEVCADVGGEVVEVVARDEDLVEAGQVLLRVIPGEAEPPPPAEG